MHLCRRALTSLSLVGMLTVAAREARAADVLTFSAGPDRPAATAQLVVVAGDDGMVYLFGGFSTTGGSAVTDVRKFDPTTGVYTDRAPLPVATRGACGALLPDGRIVIVGGYDDGATPSEISATQIYTPSTDTWTAGASTPSGWECAAVTGDDGFLHLLGGEDDSTANRSYDPTTDIWTDLAVMPTQRVAHGAGVAPDGKVYVFGGDFDTNSETSMDVWDPMTDTWTAGPALPSASVQAAFVSADGVIFSLGGSTTSGNNAGPYFDAINIFDPMNDTWTTSVTVLSTPIREANAGVVGGVMHVFGGSTGAVSVIHQMGVLDGDDDGIGDPTDGCPDVADPNQVDTDNDGIGDACDVCLDVADPNQVDTDNDGIGDACDVCPNSVDPNQIDTDNDGVGDVCDACPADPANDADGDAICGDVDNCPTVANSAQEDSDNDGVGDACESTSTSSTSTTSTTSSAGGGGEGGSGGSSTSSGGAGSGGGNVDGDSETSDGCSCRVGDGGSDGTGLVWAALGCAAILARRRRIAGR